MPQSPHATRFPHNATKIPSATTKTQRGQINKFFIFKKREKRGKARGEVRGKSGLLSRLDFGVVLAPEGWR